MVAAHYASQNDSYDIDKIKSEYGLNIDKFRAIRRDVVRNTAHNLIKAEKNSNLEELNTMLFDFNSVIPLNIKIIDDDLYFYNTIDHYLNIIESSLSVIKSQYEDINKIKTYITKNEITTETIIKSYKNYVSYSDYFIECFDLITDDEIQKFILRNLLSTNEMSKQTTLMTMRLNQDDIPFDIPDPFDERRIELSIFESFNVIKIINYWDLSMFNSEFVNKDLFRVDINKSIDKTKSSSDFNKLKPNFEIIENSPTAIWYLAILHAYCDGEFDETDNLLLVNTMKICLAVTAKINKIKRDKYSDYFEKFSHDNELLMNFLNNDLSKVGKITDVEFWDAYLEASDKITDPDLQDFVIAICVWVAQVETADIQDKAIGKLSMLWDKFSQDVTSNWLYEINAYATGDKG